MKETIKLSILDTEKKYSYEIDEKTYGANQMVQWGADNAAPLLYRNCYRNSATLKSIIDGSVNYVLGDNIIVNAGAWQKEVNRRGMTMRQFVAHLAMSFLTFGGYAFQVVYNRLFIPVELFPLDLTKIRTNESGSKVWFNKKGWAKYSTKAEEFDAWNPEKIDPEKLTQIFVFKGDFTSNVYPLPPYYGAIADVLTEIECGRYSLNSVTNGFSGKYIINFPEANNLTDEQKRGIEDAIKKKYSGSEAEANFLMYWSEDGDKKIEISKIEGDDTPDRYIAIKDNARQNIFISMRATPNLFGLPTATTGFNSQEYTAAMKLFERTVIDPIRDGIKESISKVVGVENAIQFVPFTISFDDSKEE